MRTITLSHGRVNLGLQTFWGARLEAPFAKARELKLGAVEIFFDKKDSHGFMPVDLKQDAREAVRAEIAAGIQVSVHAPLLDFEGKAWKRELAETMIFCRETGCAALTIHPPLDRPPAIKEMAAVISGSQARTEILFENTPDIRVPALLDGFVHGLSDGLGSEVGVTFDAGHANLSGMPPHEYIERLGSTIKHLHLHDNNGRCDEHLSPGQGNIDFARLFKTLGARNFLGMGILEYWRPEVFNNDIGYLAGTASSNVNR